MSKARKNPLHHYAQAGFSLVQMSIIVTIMGLATAASIPGGKQGQPIERQMSTEEKLDHVQKAMTGYKASTGALPCPADARLAKTDVNFGLAAVNSGTCVGGTPAAPLNNASAVVGGMIPVRTLGIEDMYAFDGYGRRITYVVDSRATNPTSCLSLTQATAALQVKDASGVTTNTYAAYISHGPSGYGAYPANGASTPLYPPLGAGLAAMDPDKLDNASFQATGTPNFDASFVKKEKANSYDDIVRTENTCCTGAACDVPPYDGPEVAWAGSACDWNPPGWPTGTTNGAQLFKKNAGQFDVITPKLPAMFGGVNNVTFSPDNTYFIVGASVNYSGGYNDYTVFKRNGLTMTKVQDRLINNAFVFSGIGGITFSPDSRFLFASLGCCTGQLVAVWQRSGDTFSFASGNSTWDRVVNGGYLYGVTFTKTTNEMILNAGVGSGPPANGLYKYNPSAPYATAFTMVNGSLGGDISGDGNYIMRGIGYNCPSGGCSGIAMYKRRPGTNEFDYKDTKPARITYLMKGSWSPDNLYYAISGSYGTVPFEVYKLIANDKIERLDNIDFYPSTGSGYSAFSVDWSADGQFIASGAYDYSCSDRSGYYFRKYGDNFYFQDYFRLGTNPYTGNAEHYAHTWAVDFRN